MQSTGELQQMHERIRFTCNICGSTSENETNRFHRELPDCHYCGSTPRFRGLALALCESLFGRPVLLIDAINAKNLHGLGMSDWPVLVALLDEKFSHTNTFFHTEPRYDVMKDEPSIYRNLDYVICSEVFEHVLAPLERGFKNLRRMLRPGGSLIFSTPYTSAPETLEHFPGMRKFTLQEVEGVWELRAKIGWRTRVYRGLIFHGGPGTVLEMRVWSKEHLFSLLNNAGFTDVRAAPFNPSVGYCWPLNIERPEIGHLSLNYIISAKAPSK